ncbi:TOM (translocase of outer membrane) complex component [Blastocladiella emersonii ATCC 22665]|nr:TOM (translocase of outer membrane) complex component [Blastocladiella emersonii ATCC 22665]
MTNDNTRKWLIAAVLIASLAGIGALYVSRQQGAAAGSAAAATREAPKKKKVKAEEPAAPEVKKAEEPPTPAPVAPPAAAAPAPAPVAKEEPAKDVPVAKKAEPVADVATEAPAVSIASPEVQAKLSPKQKEEMAQKLKAEGNELYKAGKFSEALSYYSRAIDLQPTSSVFWCNRAACYSNLNDPAKVIEDCTKAIELDPTYVKALHRRAIAFEQLGQLRDALNDFTTMTILDGYKNPSAMNSAERLVKQLSEEQAMELLPKKTPALPSSTFVSAYLEAFRPKPCAGLQGELAADSAAFHLARGLDLIKSHDYEAADAAISKAVALLANDQKDDVAAYAHNMHGTFFFLKGQIDAAAEAFEKSLLIDAKHINTMIKCSNILMEKGDATATLSTFEKALQVDENDPDIYYHRGQVKFLMNDFGGACLDYQKSIDLDPAFPSAYIQLGVSQYKLGSIQTAMGTFKTAMTMFPKTSDVFNYYAELLQDQGRFAEAVEYYEKCIELSPNQPMGYINKAMLTFQVFQDGPAAEKLLRTALEKDPRCDIVYIQLANFLLPQGKTEEAISYFDRAIDLARTLPELVNAIMAKESVLAQYHVTKVLPASVIAEGFK